MKILDETCSNTCHEFPTDSVKGCTSCQKTTCFFLFSLVRSKVAIWSEILSLRYRSSSSTLHLAMSRTPSTCRNAKRPAKTSSQADVPENPQKQPKLQEVFHLSNVTFLEWHVGGQFGASKPLALKQKVAAKFHRLCEEIFQELSGNGH